MTLAPNIVKAAPRRLPDQSAWLVLPAALLVLAILVGPLLVLFRYSLNRYDRTEFMIETFTLDNYITFLVDPFWRDVLGRTIELAVICTLITLILALPVAYFVARAPARWKSVLIMLVVFPLFIGNAVRAAGWMALLGAGGFLNSSLMGLGVTDGPVQILYTKTAVVIGVVAVVLPFMILSIQSVIDSIDGSLEEAARSLGASSLTTFRRIVLPLALPGIIAGTILVFILCMNAYATPVLLGGPRFHVMAPAVYEQITEMSNWPFGAATAFVLMGVTLALTVFSAWLVQRHYSH